jgi:carbon storage regulator
MLVLTRKVGERIHIGESIVVTVVRIQGDKVRLGVEAPANVAVHRHEVYDRMNPGTQPVVGGDGATLRDQSSKFA